MITEAIKLFTYPARPINGGSIHAMRPKLGRWLWQPKINDWRAMIHLPTMSVFNRHGEPFGADVNGMFELALDTIRISSLHHRLGDWLDCLFIGRRTPIGKGSIVIIDAPAMRHPYKLEERYNALRHAAPVLDYRKAPLEEEVYAIDTIPVANKDDLIKVWEELQALNKAWGCDFYEGLVAKDASSYYPVQAVSPERKCTDWIKHRWKY